MIHFFHISCGFHKSNFFTSPFDEIPCGNLKNSVETLVDTFFLGLQGIATVFHNPQPLQQL